MTEAQITELRHDIIARHPWSGDPNTHRSTNLELREYQRMMKKVIANDPFIGTRKTPHV